MHRLIEFYQELRRRRVFRAASVYLVAAWGTILGASELLPNFDAPQWILKAIMVAAGCLFPAVVAIAWYYEVTGRGLVRDPRDQPGGGHQPARSAATLAGVPLAGGSGVEARWQEGGVLHQRVFSDGFCLGRDASCDVSTLDPLASRLHASVQRKNGIWMIEDTQSRNGTLLNGERLTMARPLPSRCSLQLGAGGQAVELRILDRSAETMTFAATGD
ncbi:MAG: FHA domain-containing protein [Pseudomonadales bacterium]